VARKKVSLEEKVLRGTGVKLSAMTPERCVNWRRSQSGLTPVMRHEGRLQTVRRVLFERLYGKLGKERVDNACGNILCVNPHHALVQGRGGGHDGHL
jgi:hypothetical protein